MNYLKIFPNFVSLKFEYEIFQHNVISRPTFVHKDKKSQTYLQKLIFCHLNGIITFSFGFWF